MKSISWKILAAIILISGGSASAQYKVGDQMPEFKLPYATKDTIIFDGMGSKDLTGKRYLLAFYPADWSGGCTKEVCSFRDAMTDFDNLNLIVLGVSVDSPFSHFHWANDENLNFKLLSDQTHKLGIAMGVYDDQRGMFKRSVFVVGPSGKFEYINYNYSVKDDTDFNAIKRALGGK
jgi:peroxiredoxin